MKCEDETCLNEVVPRPPVRGGGGGLPKRFCSPACQNRTWLRIKNRDPERAAARAREKRELYATSAEYREKSLRRNRRNERRRQRYASQLRRARAAGRGAGKRDTLMVAENDASTAGMAEWARLRGYDPETRSYTE